MSIRATLVTIGGVAWLLGVLVLETTNQVSDDGFPIAFPILALFAGVAVAWGLWSIAGSLDKPLARIGGRSVAASSGVLGVGFGLDLFPLDAGLGFLLAYTSGLFVLPLGYFVLGLGLLRSNDFPGWAKWIPLTTAAAGVANYGFHSLAPDIWDPPDAFWFVCIGLSWFLLGLGSLRIPTYWAEDTHGEVAGARF